MSFASQMQQFKRKTRGRATEAYQGAISKTSEAVIRNTPVDTSRLRSNWLIFTDFPEMKVDWDARDKGEPDKTINAANRDIQRADIDDTVWLSNFVYYGPFVELGTEKMAPRRFVRGAIARWDRYVQEAASEST